jgi:hypothetical protein
MRVNPSARTLRRKVSMSPHKLAEITVVLDHSPWRR